MSLYFEIVILLVIGVRRMVQEPAADVIELLKRLVGDLQVAPLFLTLERDRDGQAQRGR